MIVYVDDMLISCADMKVINFIKQEISKLYSIEYLGPVEYFLGVRIQREGNSIFLSQQKYIEDILRKFNMQNFRPVKHPMELHDELMMESTPAYEEVEAMKVVPYREAIGSLLYLSIRTRPDIAVAVGILAKHCFKPRPIHWTEVKRILRYLQGTRSHGILLGHILSLNLSLYVDSD